MRNKKTNFLFTIIWVSLVLVLSSCSSSNQPRGTEVSAANSNNSLKTDQEEMVWYDSTDGNIQVPKAPKRIIVISDADVGYFLALGITPIGVSRTALENPYFHGKLNGTEAIGDLDQGDPEKILALAPDLIVASPRTADLEKIKGIAPTVFIDEVLPVKKLRERLRAVGKLTDRGALAEQWIERWDRKVASAKAEVEEKIGDKTVSTFSPYSKGIYVWGGGFGRGGDVLYDELQLRAPSKVDTSQFYTSISLEVLSDYSGDYIFTCPWTGDDGDASIVYDSVLWKHLPAVQNNRVFQIDPKASYYNDPVTLEGELDFIVDRLTHS